MLTGVCEALRRDREREIRHLAEHAVQMQNELAAYQHAVAPVEEMLRKHTGYRESEPYKRIQADIKRLIDRLEQKRLAWLPASAEIETPPPHEMGEGAIET